MMILTPGVVGVVALSACQVLLIILLLELTWAQQKDGHALRRLRGVFWALIFLFAFPLAAGVDMIADISPGMTLYHFLGDWIWVARCILVVSLARFWLSLHEFARNQGRP